jgi:hypothetical protein
MTANAYRSRVEGLRAARVALVVMAVVCAVLGRGCGR